MDKKIEKTEINASSDVFDHKFWIKYAQDLMTNSIPRMEKAADKIQTMAAWLWSIYTGAVTVGAALAKQSYSSSYTIFLSIPSLLLIISYFLAGWAQMPKREYRVLEEAKNEKMESTLEAYNKKRLKHKYYKVYSALWILLLATVWILVAIVVVSLHQPNKAP